MLIAFLLQSGVLFSLLKSLGVLFLISFVLYIYYAITLMVIAHKTATNGAGLAWLPIGNLFLMCKIGRRPGWWVLLCFVPVLNLLFLAMLWMSMAEMRGKPAWIGSLAIIPIVGFFVPIYLALGQQSPNTAATIASRNCPSCGVPIIGNESFCRNCGKSAPTVVSSQPRMSTGLMALISGGTTLVTFILLGVFGWFIFFRALSYEPPERKQPDMPERTAGTITEFPVDADKEIGPDSIIVEDNTETIGKGEPANRIPKERMPPGTIPETIRKRTTTRTSVVYRKKKKEGQQPAGPDVVIYVTVVRVAQGQTGVGDAIAVDVVKASGSNRKGVDVKSPRGGIYKGSVIRTSTSTIYVLEKQNSDIVILIYSPTSAGDAIATRLASSVGNGDGLNDYPATRTTIWTLPQRPPNTLTLVDFYTQTRAEMGLSQSDMKSRDAETQKWLDYVSQFIPERATQARYRDSQGRRWDIVVYDYESTRKAWNTWMFLRWTVGFGSTGSVTVKDEDGLYADTDEGRILIFQRGPYLISVRAPAGTPIENVVAVGNTIQV